MIAYFFALCIVCATNGLDRLVAQLEEDGSNLTHVLGGCSILDLASSNSYRSVLHERKLRFESSDRCSYKRKIERHVHSQKEEKVR